MIRFVSLAMVLVACGGGGGSALPPEVDAPPQPPDIDAPPDAHEGVPLAGFGDLAGQCGVLNEPELAGIDPALFRGTLTFERGFVDPADRPLLTAGGLHMAETPNAGGSSAMSEVFAFEQLARCELAGLLKTETEIVYTTPGKITDLEVTIDSHKIGVSVTRAVMFPFGQPYTEAAATTLIQRKLEDILVSTANVSPEDHWDKQILAVLAYDDQHADVVEQAWAGFDASVRADTLLVVTVTNGDDAFIYSNN
ncbi:MAG: hypothetical protein ABI867_30250 [Kofleriaceae bacterium]